jgi:prefoldin subunit 5
VSVSSSPSPTQAELARQLAVLTAQMEILTRERDHYRQRVTWLETQLERLRFGQGIGKSKG